MHCADVQRAHIEAVRLREDEILLHQLAHRAGMLAAFAAHELKAASVLPPEAKAAAMAKHQRMAALQQQVAQAIAFHSHRVVGLQARNHYAAMDRAQQFARLESHIGPDGVDPLHVSHAPTFDPHARVGHKRATPLTLQSVDIDIQATTHSPPRRIGAQQWQAQGPQ